MSEERIDDDGNVLRKDICPEFMTKTMTLNTEYRRSPFEDRLRSHTAHYWCQITMDVHGPDDDDVMPDTCGPERGCFDCRHPKS